MLDGQPGSSWGTTDHDRIVRIEEIVGAIKDQMAHLPCNEHTINMAKLTTADAGRESKIGMLSWLFGLGLGAVLLMLGWLLVHVAGSGK